MMCKEIKDRRKDMKTLFSEEEMRAIDGLRKKGLSWRKIERRMLTVHRISHHSTTFMRHYNGWKMAEEVEDAIKKSNPSILDRIMRFFGM